MDCSWIKVYDMQIGGTELNPHNLTPGQTVYLDISGMPSGYEFLGWKDSGGNLLGPDVIVEVKGGRYEAVATCGSSFVASLKAEEEEVCILVVQSDNPEMGDVTPSEQYSGCNTSVVIKAKPKNCCYEFLSWSDDSEDRDKPEREVTVLNGTTTYTAFFGDVDYTVTALSNNDEWGVASVEPSVVHCGDMFNLTATPLDGYRFLEWNDGSTEANRTIQYECGIDTVYTATFGLSRVYSLTYYYNYETDPDSGFAGYFQYGDPVTFWPAPYREGYVFLGWALDSDATQPDFQPDENGTFSWYTSIALFGVWTEVQSYDITYVGSPTDTSHVYFSEAHAAGESFDLWIPEPSVIPTGYVFNGWQIAEENAPYDNLDILTGSYTMPEHNMVAHGYWSTDEAPEKCTVTYAIGDLSVADVVLNGITSGTTIIVKDPSELGFYKPRYIFQHWSISPTQGQAEPGNLFTVNNDTIFTGVWVPDREYTIVYDLACTDATGDAPEAQKAYYNGAVVVPDDSGFSRNGYYFLGWTPVYGSTVPVYAPGQTIIVTDSVTLYAVWQTTPAFHVYYNQNNYNASCSVEDDKYYAPGDIVVVMGCSCVTPTGCTCSGWNTQPDGSGTTYLDGDTFEINANTVLYAMWDCCEVTFYNTVVGVDLIINGNVVYSGTTVNIDEDTTYDVGLPYGCCFVGWFDVDTCSYINPCGEDGEPTYLLVPRVCDTTDIDPNRLISFSDADFVHELSSKDHIHDDGVYIYNTDTGEMRQSVRICESESYPLECGSNVMAVTQYVIYTETSDTSHEYEVVDKNSYTSIYTYLEANPMALTSNPYVGVVINGIQYNYIVSTCDGSPL